MKKLRTFAVSMIIAAIGLLIYCAGFYIKSYEQNLAARQEYAELSQMAGVKNREGAGLLADGKKTDEDSSTKNSEKKRRKKQRRSSESKNKNCTDEIRESFGISWENLRKINPRTVAWITVPGADISYPVVQGDDDEFYLKHNFQDEENLFGCIFLGKANRKDFSDSHSFLYGHNMQGNMMFANLNRYEDSAYLEQCPEFEIITPEKKYTYRIFSVEQAQEGSTAFEYGYDLSGNAYREQLMLLKNHSLYDTGIMPRSDRQIVTLVTCNSRLDQTVRMAVHGNLRNTLSWSQYSARK